MAYQDILNHIVARIETLTIDTQSIGQVRAYHQRVITPEDFASLFQIELAHLGTQPIRAWIVTWENARISRAGAPLNTYFTYHTFSVLGWVSFNEYSEELIRRMGEMIMNSFASYLTLGLYDCQVSATIVEDSSVAITGFRREQLGPVLCSAVELTITATERHVAVEFV